MYNNMQESRWSHWGQKSISLFTSAWRGLPKANGHEARIWAMFYFGRRVGRGTSTQSTVAPVMRELLKSRFVALMDGLTGRRPCHGAFINGPTPTPRKGAIKTISQPTSPHLLLETVVLNGLFPKPFVLLKRFFQESWVICHSNSKIELW